MKAAIQVTNRDEADRITQALTDPSVRAFVNIMGVLTALDTHDRTRVLAFVGATFDGRGPVPVACPPLPLDLGHPEG